MVLLQIKHNKGLNIRNDNCYQPELLIQYIFFSNDSNLSHDRYNTSKTYTKNKKRLENRPISLKLHERKGYVASTLYTIS